VLTGNFTHLRFEERGIKLNGAETFKKHRAFKRSRYFQTTPPLYSPETRKAILFNSKGLCSTVLDVGAGVPHICGQDFPVVLKKRKNHWKSEFLDEN